MGESFRKRNCIASSRRQRSNRIIQTSIFKLLLAGIIGVSAAGADGFRGQRVVAFSMFPMVDRVKKDFLALTRRSTTRHILLPKQAATGDGGISNDAVVDAALRLKQSIRNREETDFLVDAFAAAAQRYSIDKDTASRGGLLGTLVAQGYCSACPELDRASFEAPLGEIYGPMESEFGYHLVLVCERLGCPKLDGGNTRVIPNPQGIGSVLAPSATEASNHSTPTDNLLQLSLQQVGFWVVVLVAGGFMAELAAKTADWMELSSPTIPAASIISATLLS
eukprot:scaffold120297_cov62-Attheya_sp.AAC.1